jgi:VIT1/CCC1 family predicted Fe2+/Mn2+ transporter
VNIGGAVAVAHATVPPAGRRAARARRVEDEHTPYAIRARLDEGPGRSALRDVVAVGSVPLAPFVLDALPDAGLASPFASSAALTAVALFAVGVGKAMVVAQSRWRSGLETVLVGGAAAALAYAVGLGLGGIT